MTRKNQFVKWTALAAALVLVLTGGIMTALIMGGGSNTIVALDVNPSIELEVNKKEEIVEVRALNEEARIVIGDMDLDHVDLDVAINALIGSMLQNGYLSAQQNSILISVDADDEAQANLLKESISSKVSALLGNSQIEASIITQTFDKAPNADKSNDEVSSARAALIDKILASGLTDANGTPYTYDQLALLKVNDLKLIMESKQVSVEGIQSSGTASDGGLIGKDQALAIACAKAGVSVDAITGLEIELDGGKKTKVIYYEIEFNYGGYEYEYELIAATGEIVKEEIEPGDRHDNDRPVNRPETNAPGTNAPETNAPGYQNPESESTEPAPVEPSQPESNLPDTAPVTQPGNNDIPAPGTPVSAEQAKEIAFAHAGIEASAARDIDCERKTVNGQSVYEVEFEVNKADYEYEIDAESGEIVHARIPASGAAATAAEELAFNHAGVARADVISLQTEAEYRSGQLYAYRIEFELRGDMEYEYTVNAAADEILSSRVDD